MDNKIISREEIVLKVIELFKKQEVHWENEHITEYSIINEAFSDLDHLDRIDLVMDLELEFLITINDEDIVYPQEDDYTFDFKLKTIKEFVDLVMNKIAAKKGELNLSIENE